MLTTNQKIGIGIAVLQTASNIFLINERRKAVLAHNEIADFANRSAYLTLFLTIKLAEAGIEMDEFDQRIMGDPPLLIDPDNPTMFADLYERWENNSEDPNIILDFLNQLKVVRESDK